MTEEMGARINGDDVLKDRQSAKTHEGTRMCEFVLLTEKALQLQSICLIQRAYCSRALLCKLSTISCVL
jgi:hypothetical protein